MSLLDKGISKIKDLLSGSMPIKYDKGFSINGEDIFKSDIFDDKFKKKLKKTNLDAMNKYVDSLPLDLVNLNKDDDFSFNDPNSSSYNPNSSYNKSFLKYKNNGKYSYIDYMDLIDIKQQHLNEILLKDKNFSNLADGNLTQDEFNYSETITTYDHIIDEHEAYCGWFITGNGEHNTNKTSFFVDEVITDGYVYTYKEGIRQNYEPYILYNNYKIIKKYFKPFINMVKNAEYSGIKLKLKGSFNTYDEQLNVRRSNIKLTNYSKLENFQWMKTAAYDEFDPFTEKPGWGSSSIGNSFKFETNNGLSSSYEWLVQNANNYGFVRTTKNDTDTWVYKPTKYDDSNIFVYIASDSPCWLEKQYGVKYNPIENDLGDSYTIVKTVYVMKLKSGLTDIIQEEIKTITRNKLIKLLENVPNYKDLELEFRIDSKHYGSDDYLICYYKTKEAV